MCKHLVRLLYNLMVPKPQHPQALLLQPGSSLLVMRLLRRLRMLAAIDLNHQAMLQADKIQDVRTQWMLSAEFGASELAVAQVAP